MIFKSIIQWLVPGLIRLSFDCDCACASPAPPPDYSSLANASKDSAQIMADLGREQLAETRREYNLDRKVSDQVVGKQLDILDQTKTQGDDYYDYMTNTFRPIEKSMADEATKAGSEADQEEAATRAIADVRKGSATANDIAMRAGLRNGMSPEAVQKMISDTGIGMAAAEAGAANAGRTQAKTLGWAKKLDVTGMGRNLPGASQGAYSVANTAGNSAVTNQMSPTQALQAGSAAAAGTVGQGRSMLQGGLSSVLGAQSAYANSVNNLNIANSQMQNSGGGFGSMLSGIGSIGSAMGSMGFSFSSKKLKTAKSKVSPVLKGIRNLNVENWRYKKGVADEGEHTGPYAEDVKREFGDKVAPGGKMIDMISMQGVMLKAIQELDKKVDRLDGKAGRVLDGESRRVE